MTTHEINILIERYLNGETTLAEERELALAVQREDRPAEWAIIAEMLGELTMDEAIWTHPQPLPEWRGVDTTFSEEPLIDEVTSPLHSDFCPSITRGGRGEWGRGWVRWAAAACATIAFGLSYNIIKEELQETAKAHLPQAPVELAAQQAPADKEAPQASAKAPQAPAKAPQAPAKQEAQQAPIKAQPPQLATAEAPSNTVLSCDWSHDNNNALATNTPASAGKAPKEASLPAQQPQLIAAIEEPTLPTEDLSLCMALLAEVEARAVMLQQTQQTHPQPLSEWRGEVTTPINGLSEYTVSTPSLTGRDGVGLLLLDELLANIQQQSNRPELSL